MPAAVALPAIVGALGVGAGVYGTHKQAQAQNRARQDQLRANQEAMNYERNRARNAWNQYRQEYDAWYKRFGDKGVNRYGIGRGITLPSATPAPEATPGVSPPTPTSAAPMQEVFKRGRTKANPRGGTLGGILSNPSGRLY